MGKDKFRGVCIRFLNYFFAPVQVKVDHPQPPVMVEGQWVVQARARLLNQKQVDVVIRTTSTVDGTVIEGLPESPEAGGFSELKVIFTPVPNDGTEALTYRFTGLQPIILTPEPEGSFPELD